MGAQVSLGDSTRAMELYAVGSPHAETMLVAYLPHERLLIEADLYTPLPANAPPSSSRFASYLLDAVKSRGMNVDRVVPLHRHVVPFSGLLAATQKGPPAAP